MRSVAPRIVNDVSYVRKINHESHLAWQGQYLVMLAADDVAYVTTMNDAYHFSWQGQHLVRLEGDACCSAHCK